MEKHASSSRSQPDTPNNVISTSKGSSSVSAERELDAWVKASAKELLKAIANWKRAGKDPDVCPGTVTRYNAVEGTENNLRHNLGLIYKKYGPLYMYYKGCDNLARHWVSGWETDIELQSVQKVLMCVCMKELLPGQSPVLERIAPHRVTHTQMNQTRVTHTHSDECDDEIESEEEEESEEESEEPNEDHEVWSGEELTEKEEVWSLKDSEEKNKEKYGDRADWVDIPSGGIDLGDWTRPNDVSSVVKDTGRFFLEAIKKGARDGMGR